MTYPKTSTRGAANTGARDERLDRLLGQRGKDQSGAAVTRENAASLGNVAIGSKLVSTAPTADEHNALVRDVHALAAALNAMGAKFTGL